MKAEGHTEVCFPRLGTLAQINALLNTDGTSTVSYIDNNGNPAASATLSLSINDGGNTGSGGAQSGSDTSTINITALNDPPSITAPGSAYFGTPGNSIALNGISFADVDAESGLETVTFDVGSGTLLADGSSGVAFGGTDPTDLTATGTITDLNSLISNGHLHFSGSSGTTLTINMTDNGNTPSPAQSATQQQVSRTFSRREPHQRVWEGVDL